MGWDFESIQDLNPPQPRQTRSRLDHLLRVGAVSAESLCELSDALEAHGPGHVGALFQLPYPIFTDDVWHILPTTPDSVSAEVKWRPTYLSLDDHGAFSLSDDAAEVDGEQSGFGRAHITQGMAVLPVWGKRQMVQPRYRSAIDAGRMDTIIVSKAESWIQNSPITAAGYQANFAQRLRREVAAMLRSFLPVYSVLSRSEAPVLGRLHGYVAMLAPGRLASSGPTLPLARYLLTTPTVRRPAVVEAAALQSALKFQSRQIGRFESQLFAMERLRRDGEIALSLIGTVALLEWLLNTALAERGAREANLVDTVRSPSLSFIPRALLQQVDEARKIRNRLVHGEPPRRHAIDAPQTSSAHGRETGIDQHVSSDELRALIDVAFEVFRTINLNAAR